jgi:ribonuclease P/MRP protein subunit RPP40
LDAHFPIKKIATPQIIEDMHVKMPNLKPPVASNNSYVDDFEDYAVEIHEWLSLIQLNSPRINFEDKIDPFLSRYSPPGESFSSGSLIKLTWQGFISPAWAHKTFVQIILAAPRNAWFVCSVASFGEGSMENCKDCTILKLPDAPNEYVLWEIA